MTCKDKCEDCMSCVGHDDGPERFAKLQELYEKPLHAPMGDEHDQETMAACERAIDPDALDDDEEELLEPFIIYVHWGEITARPLPGRMLQLFACSKEHELLQCSVKFDDFDEWVRGAFVQDAFPYLSVDTREFLMSGVGPLEWERMFPAEDEGLCEIDPEWMEVLS